MSVAWTEEQQKVIDLRDRNILVSAAAGSGKTAVLVERIIRRLTDEEHPVDVDRLLIVTFTEAAAAEMKERIRSAIEEKLEERPGDAHLERQATLIHSALITTIHSFCLSVIREHFHVTGLDPSFRVAEEGELRLMKQDVLDELLEECYARGSRDFLDFTERYGSGKTDRKMEELILKLYEYSRSYPQPERWLDDCIKAYTSPDLKEQAAERVRTRTAEMRRMLEYGLGVCEEPDGPYMYADMLESDMKALQSIEDGGDFAGMYEAAANLKWKRLSAKKDDAVSPEKKEVVKRLRQEVKTMAGGLVEDYFYAPVQVWEKDLEDAAPSMAVLADLVKQFAAAFDRKKRAGNMIDFNDMEQFALRVLTEEKDGELVPSAVAAEYQDQFDEVMIDEYQDSNLVQETILTCVSKVPQGRYDLFMVGDVKQSIYSFRLSRPELFMEKYDTYSREDGVCQRIDLHRNFRSRKEVLDSVNYIFRQVMRKELGGIAYDDDAALCPGASFPEPEEDMEAGAYRTELLLFDREEMRDADARKEEARMAAGRIRELLRNGMVTDRATGAYRRVRCSDIVILTRSMKGTAEVFSSVLSEEGIPACAVSREGYFETYEVSILLDYLKILDNERQDLPLAAALTSPFAGLDTNALAQIRIAYPNLPFYEAARAYAAEGGEEGKADRQEQAGSGENKTGGQEAKERLQRFFAQLDWFRQKVPFTPIHDLLQEIIGTTGYDVYIAAMPGGAQRLANVEMLTERAAAFEGTSYRGLFNFIRYIGQLRKYEVDYGEAGLSDGQEEAVRIMSIHKSKGLEFPVVFVSGLGKRFNMQDTRGSVLLHPDWGAGLDLVDLENRTKTATFLKNVIRVETALENLAEEMRILYVAMTRAKEKLILTGAVKTDGDGCVTGVPLEPHPESARKYLDWVLPSILSAGTGNVRKDAPVDVFLYRAEDLAPARAEEQAEVLAEEVLRNWDASRVRTESVRELLDAQMDYTYPWKGEEKMKLKFTVSELKKRTMPAEEAGEELYAEPAPVPLIPEFLKEEETLTGAPRGSAYHRLMELLDFTETYTEETLAKAAERMEKEGRLTADMAGCISLCDVLRFLACESGKRMSAAARQGNLYREQPFVLAVDASAIYPEDRSGEKILVQGIIDAYYEEPDGLTVLDYKTDRVRTGEELKEKYHAQLDYYAQALEQLTGKTVKEKVIYSFTLGKEIQV
ncbi:MAG TPA: helicase-exonuclease AddAB subunit AddA [Candidatus Mediterraneibacter merdipullorum]|nr:helicase-exonuclease AddAB subunit AddA [Candidatus Mediterraneibacter merdipullorum]